MNNEAFYLIIGICGFMFGLISFTHDNLEYKGYESAHSCTGDCYVKYVEENGTPAQIEQRKQAAFAKSWGVENLPKGIVDKKAFLLSGVSSPKKDLRSGVSPATGASELTLTLKGASSIAIVLVAVIIHPLVALYQFRLGLGEIPAVEEMLRIEPFFCFFICGTKNFPQRKTDLEFTAKTLSNSSSLTSSSGFGK